jgi:hypothetical protein
MRSTSPRQSSILAHTAPRVAASNGRFAEVVSRSEAANTVNQDEFERKTGTESARLRVLGQELEHKRITDFEVVVENNGGYIVRGQVPPSSKIGRSKRRLGGLFRKKDHAAELDPHVEAGKWERRFSGSDLDRLDDDYRARRMKAGRPDDYSVSQVLRVVGAYVETRRWVLAGVNRTRQQIEITHRDASGHVRRSQHTYAALYDFALRLHDGRSATP